jgi:iron(II)-dependent oxidoreductase
LPREDEWEFAARSGKNDYLYPWGQNWGDGLANIKSKTSSPQPVGSYPKGASSQDVSDLIGNVWEWTSSKASMYPGHPQPLTKAEENKMVVRGGCYLNEISGDQSVTAASRRFFEPSDKKDYIGFRLVRSN